MSVSASPIATYLDIIVPWDASTYVNIHAFELDKTGPKPKLIPKASRAARDRNEATGFAKWADSMGWEVYACTSSQRQTGTGKPDKRGRVNYRALRGEGNAVAIQVLYLDIDVKEGGYSSLAEAVGAVLAFCTATGLPLPSASVGSGGGLHVYWVLTAAIDPVLWKDIAYRLAEACRQHGLKADHNVTVDVVRLLRVPGTTNRKYATPIPVTLDLIGPAMPVEVFQQSLARFSPGTGPPKNLSSAGTSTNQATQQDLTNFPIIGPPVDVSDYLAGVTPELPTLEEVAAGCPFVKETLDTRGAGQREPLWFAAGHVAIFTEGGLADYHRLSDGHVNYSPGETDEKYQRVLSHKQVADQGWPRCVTIANAGAIQCSSCQHFKHNKSPLNFLVKKPPEPDVTPGGNPPGNSSNYPPPPGGGGDKPPHLKTVSMRGYMQDPKSGIVSVEVLDKQGNPIEVELWGYPLWNLEYKKSTGGFAIHFDTEFDATSWAHVIVPTEMLSTGERLKACLTGKHGLGVHSGQLGGLLNFMTDFQTQMRAMKLTTSQQEMMGWSDGPSGDPVAFIYGPTRYNCAGNTPFFQTEKLVRDLYFPTGTRDAWDYAIKMINAEQRPEMDVLVATFAAAPLMRFTGQSGVVISAFSSGSAHHKSTALRIGQAAWGAFKGINQLTDTLNNVIQRLGKTRVMPAYYDEMKASTDIEKFALMVYVLAGGRGKGRLTRNSEIMDVGTWETMLVGASNDSLVNYMMSHDQSTEAGINRIFEFPVGPPSQHGQIPMGDAGEILKRLETNYGHAGAIYAEHLGKSVDTLPRRVKDMVNKLEIDFKSNPDERFWVAAAAALLIGAQMVNDLNLTRFDVDRMKDFLANNFVYLRKARAFGNLNIIEPTSMVAILARYLNSNRRSIIVTDTMVIPPGRKRMGTHIVKILNFDEVRLSSELAVHYAEADHRLRISVRHMTYWLTKAGLPAGTFIPEMVSRYGGVMKKQRIGVGTDFTSAEEKLIELSLAHPDLTTLFDN